eukprot:285366-Rhodomonas_salina.1
MEMFLNPATAAAYATEDGQSDPEDPYAVYGIQLDERIHSRVVRCIFSEAEEYTTLEVWDKIPDITYLRARYYSNDRKMKVSQCMFISFKEKLKAADKEELKSLPERFKRRLKEVSDPGAIRPHPIGGNNNTPHEVKISNPDVCASVVHTWAGWRGPAADSWKAFPPFTIWRYKVEVDQEKYCMPCLKYIYVHLVLPENPAKPNSRAPKAKDAAGKKKANAKNSSPPTPAERRREAEDKLERARELLEELEQHLRMTMSDVLSHPTFKELKASLWRPLVESTLDAGETETAEDMGSA